jgi:pyruvate formate lyase activating enzyme
MIFGGLEKFSLIDHPGKMCAIVFTVGCNFRCPYCHNPEIVQVSKDTAIIEEKDILTFLETRKGKLDSVCITGGEPTMHGDLLDFMQKLKDMGFLVKLDSNGTRPQVLQNALQRGLVDYIAMDIKAPIEVYGKVTVFPVDIEKIKESIGIIKNSGIDHEFRTTIVKSLLSKDELLEIGNIVAGANRYYLQKFVPTKTNDLAYMNSENYSDEELEELRNEIGKKVVICGIR